jgi:hypothetical protein
MNTNRLPRWLCFLLLAGLLAASGGCGEPTYAEPADLANALASNDPEWDREGYLMCFEAAMRPQLRETLDAFMDNQEARAVFLSYMQRRFGDSVDIEEATTGQLHPFDLDDFRMDASGLDASLIVHQGSSASPAETLAICAVWDGRSWRMGLPAPETRQRVVKELWNLEVLLRAQERYFRSISAGIRDGTINEDNVHDHLARQWY